MKEILGNKTKVTLERKTLLDVIRLSLNNRGCIHVTSTTLREILPEMILGQWNIFV